MTDEESPASLRTLRSEILERRNQLDATTHQQASQSICKSLLSLPDWHVAQRLAAFVPIRSEVDIRPIILASLNAGKEVLLPKVLGKNRPLLFGRCQSFEHLVQNAFGLWEPSIEQEHSYDGREIDLVLTPLVGFSGTGHRLGMGAGFYDRTFAFRQQPGFHRPTLIGVAFELQRDDRIEKRSWDVPLDGLVSEQQVYRWLHAPNKKADQKF